MLKIGDFSKLARVTVKTLHHYEQIGLLRPAWIDRFTGYRYYSLQQLPRLNRILALKDLGFSLDEVARLLDRDLSAPKLRAMLQEKQEELAQRVRAEVRRLELVEVRLNQIEAEGRLLLPDAALKSAPELRVAVQRGVAPSVERVPERSQQLYRAITGWLNEAHLRPTGEWLALHDNPEYVAREVPIETAVVLETRASDPLTLPPGAVTLRWLPAVPEMACAVVSRQPAELLQGYTSLYQWVEANGYLVAGPVRECYLQEPGEETESMVEVQFPVERNRHWNIYPAVKIDKESEMATTNEVKIIQFPATRLVGLRYQGKNEHDEIAVMWDEFNRRYRQIQHNTGGAAIGVCRIPPGLPEGEFEYIACAQVSQIADVPEGMVSLELPELKVVAYPHYGKLDTLGETYEALYKGWLPQSGLEVVEPGFDMEYYGAEFDFSDKSVFYIYLPVK